MEQQTKNVPFKCNTATTDNPISHADQADRWSERVVVKIRVCSA
jgi:hypothetical protein